MQAISTLFLLACLTTVCFALDNVIVGLKYRNYTNFNGALADSRCCDNLMLTSPNCPPDQCDTSFLPCATYVGGQLCGAFYEGSTPTMENNNSFVLDKWIGNVNKSVSRLVFIGPYSPGDIHVYILAREETSGTKLPIANFSFVIDWMDTWFSNPPNYRQLVLTDTQAELGLDVFYQCVRSYYGPTCSNYCSSTNKYNCLNDGTKNCTEGWQGLDCDNLVPFCTPGLCQNGGTCVNLHLDYNCTCTQQFAGKNCETDLTVPSTTTAFVTAPATTAPPQQPASTTTISTPSLQTTTTTAAPLTTTLGTHTVPVSKQPGAVTNKSSPGSSRNANSTSTKTTPSSSGKDATVAVATSVPIALCVLGLAASVSVYLYKKMKRSSGGEKVGPEPQDSTEVAMDEKSPAVLDEDPQTQTPPEAWASATNMPPFDTNV